MYANKNKPNRFWTINFPNDDKSSKYEGRELRVKE
jgi:hypothetical protein